MADDRLQGRPWLLAGLVCALAMPAAANVTTGAYDARAPLDGAALGDSGPPQVSDPNWVLNVVEPDATDLVQETVALSLLPTSAAPEPPAAKPVEAVAATPARSPSPRNWAQLIQIAAAPAVLVIGGSLLVWYARHSGHRRRRSGHSRRRAS